MSEKTLSEQSYALCIEIEALPASEKQTQVSVMASELRVACESAEATLARAVEWMRKIGCAYCGADTSKACSGCRREEFAEEGAPDNWTPPWPEGE